MTRWHKIQKDEQGSVLIEAALILPILILAWLGTLDVRGLVLARTKVTSAIATMSDLTARREAVTTASLNAIAGAGGMVMQPLAVTDQNFSVTIASVGFDESSGDPVLFWRHQSGAHPPAIDPQTAHDLGTPGESVIVAALSYDYPSLFGLFTGSAVTLTETTVMRPRLVAEIPLNGETKVP